MTLRSLAASALLLVSSSALADALPSQLVGVWAVENAVFNGQALVRGQALYLGADGVGAWIFGPPAVGVKVLARFDAKNNTVELDLVENAQVVSRRQLRYDAARNVVETLEAPPAVMQHRSSEFSAATRKALGL